MRRRCQALARSSAEIRGTLRAAAAAPLIVLAAAPGAAEVIDLRLGYWEALWIVPEQPTTREFICITPEDLESMRFARRPDGCTTALRSQTRRHYEATSVCVDDGERMTIRWVVEAPDPMHFELRASYEGEGKTQTVSATYRWLQGSCTASTQVPNS